MEDDRDVCSIWATPCRKVSSGPDWIELESARAGGKYRITGTAAKILERVPIEHKASLTSWLVDQRALGVPSPMIDSQILDAAALFRKIKVSERVDRFLLWLDNNI